MKNKFIKTGFFFLGVFLSTSFPLLSADCTQNNNNNHSVFAPQQFEKTHEELVEWFPGCSKNDWSGHFGNCDSYYNFSQKTEKTVPVKYTSDGRTYTLHLRENVEGLGKNIFPAQLRWQYLKEDMLDFIKNGQLNDFPGLAFIHTVIVKEIRDNQFYLSEAIEHLPEKFQNLEFEKVVLDEEETFFNLETVLQIFYTMKKNNSFCERYFSQAIFSFESESHEKFCLSLQNFLYAGRSDDFQLRDIGPDKIELVQHLVCLQKAVIFNMRYHEQSAALKTIKNHHLNQFFDSVPVDYSRYFENETAGQHNLKQDFETLVQTYQRHLSNQRNIVDQLQNELLK